MVSPVAEHRFTGFVSYAHADAGLVERFLALMAPRCQILRDIEVDAWWDRQILVGQRWAQEIAAAMESADFGLLCVSPSFLASPYIAQVELPGLLGDGKIIVPVGLDRVDLDRADLRSLDELWIFSYRSPRGHGERWFSECAGPNTARFCSRLVADIRDRLLQRRPGPWPSG